MGINGEYGGVMSGDKLGLLRTSYGEVSYEIFRKEGYAFADKSAVIEEI